MITQNQKKRFMPTDEATLRVMQMRADKLANYKIEVTQKNTLIEYVGFRLGKNELYGIPYQYAKEVMHNMILTKLPSPPSAIAGVINRRGVIIAVIDLKKLFNIPVIENNSPYIIVASSKNITMGLLVDDIVGSASYDPDNLDMPLTFENVIKPEYVVGLYQGKTTILKVDALINSVKLLG